jgi:hypothetical protein
MVNDVDDQAKRRRRVTDTSTIEARHAVEGTMDRFAEWRGALAKIGAQAQRRPSSAERAAMIDRCAEIEAELRAARTDLIANLIETPRQVRGHSRVVDVEKALDGIEVELRQLGQKLSARPSTGVSPSTR